MSNPKTVNNIVQLFRDIADAHLQLKQFGFGDPAEVDGISDPLYPFLWVVPIQSEVKENTVEHTYRFAVSDLVHKDETNEIEVLSDCHQILEDFVKIFRYESDDYRLVNDPVLQPFTERWNDEVSGYAADLIIEFDLDMSTCNIPTTSFGLNGPTYTGSILDGRSGYSGYSGYSGIGTSGYSGTNGIIGIDGVSGYSGFSGISGVSGYSGTSGFSGVSGFSGTSGFSGVSGFSGTIINSTNRQTASYQLVLADVNKIVEMNVGSANNLTVPLNSTIAFPINTQITVAQYGSGQTTFVPETGSVLIRSAGGRLKLANQYSIATLIKIDTNEWYLTGDITA